jgi:Mg-chelatase subunit ChlI
MTDTWDRRSNETSKAYAAFTIYRDMGPERSIALVAEECRKNISLMNRWSQRHQWVSRVHDYEAHLEKVAQASREKEIADMRKRHVTLGMALQSKAAEKLKALDGKNMKVPDAIKALAEGTKLERLARGEPTETIESRGGQPLVVQMWQPPKKEVKEADSDGQRTQP